LLSFGAAGILLYLFAWMLIPPGDEAPTIAPPQRAPRSGARTTIGVLLLIVGALALLDSFMPWFWHMFSFHVIGSVVLIVCGFALILWKTGEPAPVPETPPVPPPLNVSPPRSSTRRLMRSQRGRKIAGVCAGLGIYFGVDPTIVRLIFAALVLAGGSGILLYIILWLTMPLDITES